MHRATRSVLGFVFVAAPALAAAQGAAAMAASPAPAALPSIDFSALVFGNYQYHTEPGAVVSNKFDLERAYMTFRLPVAERMLLRATLDLSPQQAGTGYVLRQKYAYLQYDFGGIGRGYKAVVRGGELQTQVIEHVEGFWPRWMGVVPVERAGMSSSADVGVSGLVTLPSGRGEVYAAITNGAGYSKPESDRFKSFAARATWTPLSSRRGIWRTLAVSAWGDLNAAASKFVAGGSGQTGPVGDGVGRDRYGIFAGVKDPRLTVGAEMAGRVDGVEEGANTKASPRTVRDARGALASAFVIARPFALLDSASHAPVAVVARVDRYAPDARVRGRAQFIDVGMIVDMNRARTTQIAFDYQAQTSDAVVTGIATTKVYAVRFVTQF